MTEGAILSEGEATSREALIERWKALFGQAPPAKTSQLMMTRMIAYQVQAQAEGGLSSALRRKLAKLAADPVAAKYAAPGSQFVREWNGKQHVVEVVDGGYRWNNETYRSLSAVAEAITGANWSGPRFFGLRR